MSEASDTQASSKLLMPLGILAILWSLMGVAGFLVSVMASEEMLLESYSAGEVAHMMGFPMWHLTLYGLAVFGGLLGCVLLVMKKASASSVLMISFFCMLVTFISNYGFDEGMEYNGSPGQLAFSAVIFVVCLALWRWALRLTARGVLR